MALVDLATAKDQLRLDHSEEDLHLEVLLDLATSLVLDFTEKQSMVEDSPAEWTEATVPGPIKAAILKQVVYLWAHRGDLPEEGSSEFDEGLAPGVKGMLRRYRDPALA